ncbi:MAG: hypothetical protein GX547_05090 [Phycisphaerae bacterium]|jgi:hypothetical protein|nr:hypothetical protein [Phycisphaerae bacterium]
MLTRVVKIWCTSLLCIALVALPGCASGDLNSAASAGPVAQQAAPAVSPQDSAVATQQPTVIAPQDNAVALPPDAVTPQPAVTPVSELEATPPAPGVAAEDTGGPKRINPQSLRQRLASADPPLLVCAYANDEKCRSNAIEGAITYNEFLKGLGSLPQGREIVFYCA